MTGVVIILSLGGPLGAADADRDFSGKWVLDTAASNVRELPGPPDAVLTIVQRETAIQCSTSSAHWSYALDGSDSRYRIGTESRNSAVKWEGSALLINTLVSGPEAYTLMDRWTLSRDHAVLTITRQIIRGPTQVEGSLVYTREGSRPAATPAPVPAAAPVTAPAPPAAPPALERKPEPASPPDVTVPKGTRVLLTLLNDVSSKRAKEGDRVYLDTAVPVAQDGRVVIPRGSSVAGTITKSRKAGKVQGKGELYIRFDSLTLPNGVTRDFRSRVGSGDGSKEGTIEGEGSGVDARTVAIGAGAGATVGGIAGGLGGAGIGAAAGGLAGVLLSKKPDVVLPRGSRLEMVLDRDLVFHPGELLF